MKHMLLKKIFSTRFTVIVIIMVAVFVGCTGKKPTNDWEETTRDAGSDTGSRDLDSAVELETTDGREEAESDIESDTEGSTFDSSVEFETTDGREEAASDAEADTGSSIEPPVEQETTDVIVSKTSDITSLTVGETYFGKVSQLFTFSTATETHTTIQGGYFDGETFYVAEVESDADGYETARIHVMSKTGETLRVSGALPLDHANNITYNSKMNKLVVSHCQSPDGHYYRYSFVDPDTFTITETGDKEFPFFSMAYSPERDMYASGEWSGETIDICNGDMELIKTENVNQPGSTSQGVFCDTDYIYFVRSSKEGHLSAEILIYDWECTLVFEIPLRLYGGIEPESINIVNGVAYVIANDWNRGCGIVYTVEFRLDD